MATALYILVQHALKKTRRCWDI